MTTTRLDWKKLPKLETDRRTNDLGNLVLELGHHDGERYTYDFEICTPKQGWQQYDTSQDAWYFGVWVQAEKRWILTYAEGDLSLVQCLTQDSFKAELASMAEFYGDPPPAFKIVDADDTLTHYYDERPTGEEVA